MKILTLLSIGIISSCFYKTFKAKNLKSTELDFDKYVENIILKGF